MSSTGATMIVDAHVHLYDGRSNHYGIIDRNDPGFCAFVGDYPALPGTWLIDDYPQAIAAPADMRGYDMFRRRALSWLQNDECKPAAARGQPQSFLFGPAEALQVAVVSVIELDAFLFQQALLQIVAAIAGQSVGHLALRVDDAMPRNIGCRFEVLEYLADKASTPRQAGHRRDLAIGGNPALGNAANYSANRRGGFLASVWCCPKQLALRRHRQLSSDSRGQENTHSVALPWLDVIR
jgi:hypothetical protein